MRTRTHQNLRVFRPATSLRIVLAAAFGFWLSVLVMLHSLGRVPLLTTVAVLFFVAFFLGCVAYFSTQAIVLDEKGVFWRGLRVRRFVPYEEIRRLNVFGGMPVSVYTIKSALGEVRFTSLFAKHRELCEMIRERAGLEA